MNFDRNLGGLPISRNFELHFAPPAAGFSPQSDRARIALPIECDRFAALFACGLALAAWSFGQMT